MSRCSARLLAGVPQPVLHRVVAELMAVDDPVFWELTDRVVNFDYVEPGVRARLADFVELVPLTPALADDSTIRPGAAAPTSS